MRLQVLRPPAALASCVLGLLFAAPALAQPNVVVIVADELGLGDVGFNGGNSIPTPNINRIAEGGVICANAYVAHPTPSANRAGLVTGRYPSRFGYERSIAWRPLDPNVGLPTSERTLAEALRPLGYFSGLIGKWHLGAHENFHPLNRGFDEFYGFLGGGHRSFPEDLTIRNTTDARSEPESYTTWVLQGRDPVRRSNQHLTDQLSLQAADFIRRNHRKPFFLLLAYNAPRAPLQVRAEELAPFQDIKDENRRKYAALVAKLDFGVGQVLDQLDTLGVADNTLVFFLSSAGGDTAATGAYNGWTRGSRGHVLEGGLRVPFAVRWPSRLPGRTTYRQPVSTLDIFATVAAATGIPEDPKRRLDGVDLMPYLRGDKTTPPHARLCHRVYDAGTFAIREQNLKLVKSDRTGAVALYDVEKDPTERTDLSAVFPERARTLRQAFDAWNAEMVAPTIPGADPREWNKGN